MLQLPLIFRHAAASHLSYDLTDANQETSLLILKSIIRLSELRKSVQLSTSKSGLQMKDEKIKTNKCQIYYSPLVHSFIYIGFSLFSLLLRSRRGAKGADSIVHDDSPPPRALNPHCVRANLGMGCFATGANEISRSNEIIFNYLKTIA